MFYTIIQLLVRIAIVLDFVLVTLIAYALSWLPTYLTRTWYPKLFRYWCWTFIRALGVDLKVNQKFQSSLPKQYILISNHPSALEDIGMPALFEARFLAKYEVQNWWVFGRISTAAGSLYVKRDEKSSRHEAAQNLELVLKAGQNVALYPEGGCKGRRIHPPFQYGCFDISLKTQVPILPVFIHYEAQKDFEWAPGETLIQKIRAMSLSFNRTANYYVFDPLNPQQFDSKEAFTDHVERLYLQWQEKYLK